MRRDLLVRSIGNGLVGECRIRSGRDLGRARMPLFPNNQVVATSLRVAISALA